MGMLFLGKIETPADYTHQLQMLEIRTPGPLQLCGLTDRVVACIVLPMWSGTLSLNLSRHLVRNTGSLLRVVLNQVLLSSNSRTTVDLIVVVKWICWSRSETTKLPE